MTVSKCKSIFAKGYTSNWSEEAFVILKIKKTVLWTHVLMILMVKKLLENFMKKNYKKQIKNSLGHKKWLKEKRTNYMSNGEVMNNHLKAGLIKIMLYKNESILS